MNLVRFNAILTWFIANLVIGFAAAVPLLSAIPLARYGWATAPPPSNEIAVAVLIFLAGTSFLTAVAVFANRALRRQLATTQQQVVAFWSVTTFLLLAPTAYFLTAKP
jgi:hypothetical protein